MAQELTINLPSITYIKDAFNELIAPGILQLNVNNKQISHGAPSIGTTNVSLAKGNVSTIGYVFLRNLDLSLPITIGSDGILYNLTLKAGEFALCRWNAAAIQCKTASGTVILEYWMVED
jgi:hypothetical protein